MTIYSTSQWSTPILLFFWLFHNLNFNFQGPSWSRSFSFYLSGKVRYSNSSIQALTPKCNHSANDQTESLRKLFLLHYYVYLSCRNEPPVFKVWTPSKKKKKRHSYSNVHLNQIRILYSFKLLFLIFFLPCPLRAPCERCYIKCKTFHVLHFI